MSLSTLLAKLRRARGMGLSALLAEIYRRALLYLSTPLLLVCQAQQPQSRLPFVARRNLVDHTALYAELLQG